MESESKVASSSERNGIDEYKTFNCHQSEETCWNVRMDFSSICHGKFKWKWLGYMSLIFN